MELFAEIGVVASLFGAIAALWPGSSTVTVTFRDEQDQPGPRP